MYDYDDDDDDDTTARIYNLKPTSEFPWGILYIHSDATLPKAHSKYYRTREEAEIEAEKTLASIVADSKKPRQRVIFRSFGTVEIEQPKPPVTKKNWV